MKRHFSFFVDNNPCSFEFLPSICLNRVHSYKLHKSCWGLILAWGTLSLTINYE